MTHDTQESEVEDIPKFYAGGKALAKGEVVVTYKDHLHQLQKAREEGYNEGSNAQFSLTAKTVRDNARHLEDQLINIGLNNGPLRGAVTTNQIIDVFKTFYASTIITDHSELDQGKK